MLIVVDQNIPFLKGELEPFARVIYAQPECITRELVRDADALIIRTRTQCDASLLEGSSVRFIATATIGYDHIDTDYCASHGIYWTACPGCNAQAVCDYIEEALLHFMQHFHHVATSLRLGIVGVGHVGKRVQQMALRNGMSVVLYDPIRAEEEHDTTLLGDVTTCDVISFHTPLTHTGAYPTYHLCDEEFLSHCQENALIINAARGGIVDEEALLKSQHPCIIDCWENEPLLNKQLLYSSHTLLASYHIAGYSLEGKRNASYMCMDALYYYFHPALDMNQVKANMETRLQTMPKGDNQRGWLQRITEQLRQSPDEFEQLRKKYTLR